MRQDANEDSDPLDRDFSADIAADRFRPVSFEFDPKDANVNLRLSSGLLQATKDAAAASGISYQSFIRRAIEREIFTGDPSNR